MDFLPLYAILLFWASNAVTGPCMIAESLLPAFEVGVQKDSQARYCPQPVVSPQRIVPAALLSNHLDGSQALKGAIFRLPIPPQSFLAAAAVAPARSGWIAPSEQDADRDDDNSNVFSLNTDSPPKNPVSEGILAKARLNGSVRVIVQLQISPGPEETREQRIHAAQEGLLKDLIVSDYQVVRRFTSIPAIALEASHDALLILNRSIHVVRVDEDELAVPFNKSSLLGPFAGRVDALT
jgi:hypothetical protein